MTRIAVLLLAAGTSSRYGNGVNKLLLPFGEATVIETSARALLAADVGPLTIITGHQPDMLEAAVRDLPVRILHNPNFRQGEMISSIQTGLRQLQTSDAEVVLIALGDMPLLPGRVVRRLVQAFALGNGAMVAPRFRGQRGHPVLIARRLWDEALALPAGSPMRKLLEAHPSAVAYLEVATPFVLQDVDTPELYQQAVATSS
jgi:molybdenum cofactor cytidylyltransferase